jgi:hypothetical protein
VPSARPIHTPKLNDCVTPNAQASRKPQEVPVL